MKRFILCFLFLFSLQPVLWAMVQIQGKVTPAAAGMSVVLLEENPNKTPQGPLARVQTDEKGNYQIELEESDPASSYRIGSRIDGELVASDPFTIAPGQKGLTINLKGGGPEPLKGDFRVKGQLLLAGAQKISEAQQVLLFSERGKNQQMVMMRKTDKEGQFEFQLAEVDPGAKYFIGVQIGKLRGGTDVFTLDEKHRSVSQNITMPAVTTSLSHLKVVKNVLFFVQYEDFIQVEDWMLVENSGDTVIDLYSSPLIKRLPGEISNFQAQRDESMDVTFLNGQAIMKSMISPGTTEFGLNYQIPLGEAEYLWGLLPNTMEMELVHSGSGMRLDFSNSVTQPVEAKQEHQGQVFFTQKILVPEGQTEVNVEISGMSLPQKKLFFPATFLLIFLLVGLFWHLKIKLPKEAKTNAP